MTWSRQVAGPTGTGPLSATVSILPTHINSQVIASSCRAPKQASWWLKLTPPATPPLPHRLSSNIDVSTSTWLLDGAHHTHSLRRCSPNPANPPANPVVSMLRTHQELRLIPTLLGSETASPQSVLIMATRGSTLEASLGPFSPGASEGLLQGRINPETLKRCQDLGTRPELTSRPPSLTTVHFTLHSVTLGS